MNFAEETKWILRKYKNVNNGAQTIPILDERESIIGQLRPVCSDFKKSIVGCVELLSRWREENPELSLAKFQITYNGTEKWIENSIVKNDGRILFVIQNIDGKYIGHIGFNNFRYSQYTAELDSVVRGEKNISPGLMTHAVKTMLRWGKCELHLKHIDLVVFPDNRHAIQFYEQCGFREDGIVPLIRIVSENEIKWIRSSDPSDNSDYYFCHMILAEGES